MAKRRVRRKRNGRRPVRDYIKKAIEMEVRRRLRAERSKLSKRIVNIIRDI